MNDLIDAIMEPLQAFWHQFTEYFPRIATAVAVLVVMILVAKLARRLITRALCKTPLDNAFAKLPIAKMLTSVSADMTISRAIGALIYALGLLIAWTTFAQVLQLTMLSEALGSAMAFLPKIFAALVIFVSGSAAASLVRKLLAGAFADVQNPGVRMVETAAEVAIYLFTGILALDTLGADTTMISSNMFLIIAGLLIVIGFLFSYSMRAPAKEIIANYYLRLSIRVGDDIEIDDARGKVGSFTPLGVMLTTRDGDTQFVPATLALRGLKKFSSAQR